MAGINQVAEKIYLIDDHIYSLTGWGSLYLLDEDKKALVDTGPSTSSRAVLEGIRGLGFSPADIDYIIVTHIHLDHAGGAGTLIREMPKAQVIVHHRGAKHLINPERLVHSAIEAYGEEGLAKDGEVVPLPTERVRPVSDGEVIALSAGQRLTFMETPGHAPHELCIRESRNNGVFTGDAAGVFVNRHVFPSCQPPNFDMELELSTLERLKKSKTNIMYFAHFGASNKVEENLQRYIDELHAWDKILANSVQENTFDRAQERLIAYFDKELVTIKSIGVLYDFFTQTNLPLSAAGFIKYYAEKHHIETRK